MPAAPAQIQRVLLVDDDAVMRDLLPALLEIEGYAVEAVESGEAALQQLEDGYAPSVVLTDMQLPGLVGAELARRLRALHPGLRIIGMSGSPPESGARGAFDAFLLKPFSVEEFAAAVASESTGSDQGSAPGQMHPAPLDAQVYSRLASSLPAPQLRELYRLTLEDVAGRLERMAAAAAAGELGTYRQEAHALKGGCGMVGAAELAGLAAQAEVSDAGSLVDTPTGAEFLQALERLRSMLTARFMHNG